MALKIRLTRLGSKKKPYYRVVVADSRSSRDGKFIDLVGTYDPMAEENGVRLDGEKVKTWMKNGAQPSDTVKALLKKSGVTE